MTQILSVIEKQSTGLRGKDIFRQLPLKQIRNEIINTELKLKLQFVLCGLDVRELQ